MHIGACTTQKNILSLFSFSPVEYPRDRWNNFVHGTNCLLAVSLRAYRTCRPQIHFTFSFASGLEVALSLKATDSPQPIRQLYSLWFHFGSTSFHEKSDFSFEKTFIPGTGWTSSALLDLHTRAFKLRWQKSRNEHTLVCASLSVLAGNWRRHEASSGLLVDGQPTSRAKTAAWTWAFSLLSAIAGEKADPP